MKSLIYNNNTTQHPPFSDNQANITHQFRLTPLRLAMLGLTFTSFPVWAATNDTALVIPLNSTTAATNTTSTTNTSSGEVTTNIDNQTTSLLDATAIPNNTPEMTTGTTSSAANEPYQYQLPERPIQEHITEQIQNQTLTEGYDNFNQPAATLNQNQPTVGYSAQVDNDANLPPAAPTPPAIAPINSNQAVAQAQVNEQLTQGNAVDANNPVTAQQNAANQTENIDVNETINPEDYLPEYQQQTASKAVPQQQSTVTADQPSVFKRLYNRVLNRAQGANYIDVTIANADEKQQPAKNIKAALEQVTVESVSDFVPSISRLRQIALDAAQAVGYYNTEVGFTHLGGDNIQVNVKVGEPVIVQSRIVDIRGEGGDGDTALPAYTTIEDAIPPKVGDVFNHGVYKTSKAMIEGVAQTNGFFDANWLNSSADIILPDNTADVDLVYDTQSRYQFGDVKVYSIDKDGKLTDDPNKLPIKPALLQQLMTYKNGDPYYQPFVTEFANNLSATRYFNGVDVDVIKPAAATDDGVNFMSTAAPTNAANPTTEQPSNTATDTRIDTPASTTTNDTTLPTITTTDINTQPTVMQTTTNNPVQDPAAIAPLEFGVDDSTRERLNAVKNKAESLLDAPEDLELAPETKNNSKNPLVIVANAVSAVAKKIDNRENEDARMLAQAQKRDVIPKLTPQQVYEQKALPTYVVLDATKPREAQVGLGYETDVGFRLTGQLNNNLVNRNGLQAGVNVALSKVNQSLEVNASLPYKHPLNDKLTAGIGYQHRNTDDIVNSFETDSVYANIARNIYRESGWNRTYSMRYRNDQLALDEGRYDTESLPYPFNNYASGYRQQSLLFGYALNKTVADNVLTPTYGYSQRYSAEVGVADGSLSNTNMAILRAGVTGLYSFGEDKKHQVLGRADLGYIYSEDFFNVPYRLRFSAGGDQSIRGYNTDTLGPTFGDQKFLMGGEALAVGSLEYNYEFREGLRAALFTDFGNAYDLSGEYDNSTKVGIGAGVRWASPIGTVRLDVASGLSDDGDPIRVHFFIGSPL